MDTAGIIRPTGALRRGHFVYNGDTYNTVTLRNKTLTAIKGDVQVTTFSTEELEKRISAEPKDSPVRKLVTRFIPDRLLDGGCTDKEILLYIDGRWRGTYDCIDLNLPDDRYTSVFDELGRTLLDIGEFCPLPVNTEVMHEGVMTPVLITRLDRGGLAEAMGIGTIHINDIFHDMDCYEQFLKCLDNYKQEELSGKGYDNAMREIFDEAEQWGRQQEERRIEEEVETRVKIRLEEEREKMRQETKPRRQPTSIWGLITDIFSPKDPEGNYNRG